LDRQDRALWKAERIAEGVALITDALPRGEIGPYQVQAAIAAVHDEAPSFEATDWPQILSLYELLLTMADTPLARLSHAIALAMVNGTAAGLARLTELEADARLRDHHRLEAARAHLLERDGRIREAAEAYRRAAGRTASVAERDYLLVQAARVANH
jgi:predicted RNA polymerase sigma factor